jgi:hypothetical protein
MSRDAGRDRGGWVATKICIGIKRPDDSYQRQGGGSRRPPTGDRSPRRIRGPAPGSAVVGRSGPGRSLVAEAVGQTDAVCDFLCVGHKVMILG